MSILNLLLGASTGSAALGQVAYTSPGTYSFVVPTGVTSLAAVCIGGGGSGAIGDGSNYGSGGAGGGLSYGNAIAVTPNETLTIVVGSGGAAITGSAKANGTSGAASTIARGATILLSGGGGGGGLYAAAAAGGTSDGTARTGGFAGGVGGKGYWTAGGGGAGGYSGAGGAGVYAIAGTETGTAGTGGSAGSGGNATSAKAGGGGGVGILGEGSNGAAGTASGGGGGAGSGGFNGETGATTGNGGSYGGGGAGVPTSGTTGKGGDGAVRIIYGAGLSYPTSTGSAAKDSSFANVSLLLHGDGANASTTITDSSSSPKTATATNATINTNIKKFGSGSISFGTGNNGYISLASQLTFTGDVTIEFWAYLTAASASGYSIGTSSTTVNSQIPMFYSDGKIAYYNNGPTFTTAAGKFSLNTWFHCAVVRSSGVAKVYINGTDTGSSVADTGTIYVKNISGYSGGASGYNIIGYFDDVRISNIARYTANFTAPTEAFPDSA